MEELQEELQKNILEYLINYKGPKGREINWSREEFNSLAKNLAVLVENVRKEKCIKIMIARDKMAREKKAYETEINKKGNGETAYN